MIYLAAPIALAVFALVAWRYEARSWRAYEATLTEAENENSSPSAEYILQDGEPSWPSNKAERSCKTDRDGRSSKAASERQNAVGPPTR